MPRATKVLKLSWEELLTPLQSQRHDWAKELGHWLWVTKKFRLSPPPSLTSDKRDPTRVDYVELMSSLAPWQSKILLALVTSQKSRPRLLTYKELAQLTDTHPRLVARALALNPFHLIIPCHRVIGRRALGGYQGGLGLKRLILEKEGLFKSLPTTG